MGQVRSVWAPQRGSKEGRPLISWYLFGLNSGIGPFPHIEYSRTDQGIDLCEYRC